MSGVILKFINHSILPKTCGMSCVFKIRSECTFCRLYRAAFGVKWAAGRRPFNGMLIDSWECHTQSWTPGIEAEFKRISSYSLRKWLPALFGYVIKDHQITSKFLTDWRKTLRGKDY